MHAFRQNNPTPQIIPLDFNITTIAGKGTENFLSSSFSSLKSPSGLFSTRFGEIFIADDEDNRVRKIGSTGVIQTVAGNGLEGFSCDFGLATEATFNQPSGVAVTSNNEIYIADSFNYRVRKVDTFGIITTVVGTGDTPFNGDGLLGTETNIGKPYRINIHPLS